MSGPPGLPIQPPGPIPRALYGPDLRVSRSAFARSQLATDTATDKLGSYFARRRGPALLESEERQLDDLMRSNIALNIERRQSVDPAAIEALDVAIARNMRAVADTRAAIEAAQFDDGRLVAPEVLAERYGNLDLTFDAPMSPQAAAVLAADKRRELIEDQIRSRAPEGFGTGALGFGANIIASATDPIELASAFIPIVGPAGRAALGVNAATRGARIAGRAKVGAIQGAGGAALLEPLYYGLSRDAQLDYEMSDVIANIGIGAVLGGTGGVISGAVSRAPRRSPPAQSDPLVDIDDIISDVIPDAPEIAPPVLPLPAPDRPIAGLLEPPAIVPPVSPSVANIARLNRALGVANDSEIASTALRQWINDTPIDVTALMRDVVERPPTITDFAQRWYAQAGLAAADATNDVIAARIAAAADDEIVRFSLARAARAAGYINRDADFSAAVARDAGGDLVFSRRDRDAVSDWRAWNNLPDPDFDTAGAIAQIRREYPALKRRRPTTDYVKSQGGITLGTPIAKALQAQGVTTKNTPGLFRKKGWLGRPGVDADALVRDIVAERAGRPVYLTIEDRRAAAQIADLEQYAERQRAARNVTIADIDRVADDLDASISGKARAEGLEIARTGVSAESAIARAMERIGVTDVVEQAGSSSRQARAVLSNYLQRLGVTDVGAAQFETIQASLRRGRSFDDAMRDAGIDIKAAQARALIQSAQVARERPGNWIEALMLREQGTAPPSGAGRLERPVPRPRVSDADVEPIAQDRLRTTKKQPVPPQAPDAGPDAGPLDDPVDDPADEFALDAQLVDNMRAAGELSDEDIAALDALDDEIAAADIEDAAMQAMAECMVRTKGQI